MYIGLIAGLALQLAVGLITASIASIIGVVDYAGAL